MSKNLYEKPIVEIEEFQLSEHIAKCEQSIGGFYMNVCDDNNRKPVFDNTQEVMLFNYDIYEACEFLPEEIYCYNSQDENSIAIFAS